MSFDRLTNTNDVRADQPKVPIKPHANTSTFLFEPRQSRQHFLIGMHTGKHKSHPVGNLAAPVCLGIVVGSVRLKYSPPQLKAPGDYRTSRDTSN